MDDFPSLYILDFDGTLADTGAVIRASMHRALADLGLPDATDAACTATIGLPLSAGFARLFPDASADLAERYVATYRRHFDELNVPGAVPLFPGVADALAALRARGVRLAVASSRHRRTLDVFVRNLGLDGLLDLVIGGEDAPRAKPDPAPALEVLSRLGADASSAAVVGDTAYDIEMGRNAGCHTIAVSYGYGARSALFAAGADVVIGDIAALPYVRPALAARLRGVLPPPRYMHTIGVADEARRMAARFGADESEAWLAGLLHDCAKGIPTAEQAATCDRLGVALDAETRRCPSVIHGFLGEHLARTLYGVEDETVLRAIRFHTIGGAGMSVLERIVFLADAIEPRRDFAGVDAIRAASETDLDEALRLYVAGQFRHLTSRRVPIHTGLVRLWNDLV